MARKKNTISTDMVIEPKSVSFVERDAKMITSEKMYAENSTKSMIIGVAMQGEVVTILAPALNPNDMTKIKTKITNRTGYVNSKSVI